MRAVESIWMPKRLRRSHGPLGEQGELHGVARLGEDHEEGVAGGVDFLRVGKAREDFAQQRVMALDQLDGGALAEQLL